MIDHFWDDYNSSPDTDRYKYTYDFAGNRTSRNNTRVTGANNVYDQAYQYDNLHRLANVEQGTDTGDDGDIDTLEFAQDWALDQLGNWREFKQDDDGTGWDLEQTRNHNAANEITGLTDWEEVSQDAAGNMVFMPYPLIPSSLLIVKYDAWNRLVLIHPGEVEQVRYEYDGLHRRIAKDVTAGGSTDDRHYYYNEQWQLLETRKTETGNPVEHLVWHPYYIDALAVRFYNSNGDTDFGDTDERQFVLQDANFNVTAIVNNSGDVLERYHYTPYGEVTYLEDDFDVAATQESAIANTHLYTGRERDPETGLQLNRWRFYIPPLGRWGTRDPIGYGGGWNLYAYVLGKPCHVLDPHGFKDVIITPEPAPPLDGPDGPNDYETECCEDAERAAQQPGVVHKKCKGPCDLDNLLDPPSNGGCIRHLDIVGHGNADSFWIGNVNRGDPDDQCMICTPKDAEDAFGGMKRKFCRPCVITLRVCLVGRNEELMEQIAKETRCLVRATDQGCYLDDVGGGLPIPFAGLPWLEFPPPPDISDYIIITFPIFMR